jgi:hypothetical protein
MELRPSAVFLLVLTVAVIAEAAVTGAIRFKQGRWKRQKIRGCDPSLRRKPALQRKLGREDRFRTVISGMEPRRIAVVMLLPRLNP